MELHEQPAWPAELVELYRSDYPKLVRAAFLIVGSSGTAEEIVQDAFVAMVPKWGSVTAPAGYVRTSVVNGARAQLRRWGIEKKYLPDALPPAVPSTSVELHDALQTLPERQRVAVVLRYFIDLDDNAIGEALDCKPATVRSLVHRGVKALQKLSLIHI